MQEEIEQKSATLQPVRTSRMYAIWSSGKSSMTTC